MSFVVPIKQVIPATDNLSKRAVYKMRDILVKQGQIEPLQVAVYEPTTPTYITFHQDLHGNEIMAAAKLLGWPTVLIVVMKRYEE